MTPEGRRRYVGQVRQGVNVPDMGSLRRLVALARDAEAAGWDGVFLQQVAEKVAEPTSRGSIGVEKFKEFDGRITRSGANRFSATC